MTSKVLIRNGKSRISSELLFGFGENLNSNRVAALVKERFGIKDLTPTELTLRELDRAFDLFPDVTDDLKRRLISFITTMPQLRIMNMELTALTLLVIDNFRDKINKDTFSSEFVNTLINVILSEEL